jgi:hypothetical protein
MCIEAEFVVFNNFRVEIDFYREAVLCSWVFSM